MRPQPVGLRVAADAEGPVDRTEDGASRRDAPSRQAVEHGAERALDRHDESVEHVTLARVARRETARGGRQARTVACGDCPPARDEGVEAAELAPAERRLDVRQLEVEPRSQVLALVVVPRVADARDPRRVAGDGAALPRRQQLGRVEGVDGQSAARSDRAPRDPGADRLGAVLHDGNAEGEELVEVQGEAEGMDDDDGARAAREAARHILGGRPERRGVGVGEDRRGPTAGDGVVERVAGVRGNDDLGAGSDVERTERQLQRRAARAHGRDVRDTEPRRELALEPLDLVALGQVAGAHDARHALGVLRAHRRPRVRDHCCGDRRAGIIRGWRPRGPSLTNSGAIGPTGTPRRT